MNKLIIALCGKCNTGKSKTIKEVYEILASEYEEAPQESLLKNKRKSQHDVVDVSVIVTINGSKIGIEGKGDPKDKQRNHSRLEKSIKAFIDNHQCTVIICSTRTKGETFKLIDQQSGYTVIRKLQEYKRDASDQKKSNHHMAQEIVTEVKNFLCLNH